MTFRPNNIARVDRTPNKVAIKINLYRLIGRGGGGWHKKKKIKKGKNTFSKNKDIVSNDMDKTPGMRKTSIYCRYKIYGNDNR